MKMLHQKCSQLSPAGTTTENTGIPNSLGSTVSPDAQQQACEVWNTSTENKEVSGLFKGLELWEIEYWVPSTAESALTFCGWPGALTLGGLWDTGASDSHSLLPPSELHASYGWWNGYSC